MKHLISIVTILLSPFFANADCAGGGVNFWPTASTLYQNPIIIIEGYGKDQRVIESLNTAYKVYLQSGETKIPLVTREICRGQYSLTQAILEPSEHLEAGQEYTLVIDDLDYAQFTRRWNATTQKHEPVKWTVIQGTDEIKPSWTAKPSHPKKSYIMFGCGPGASVNFNIGIYDQSAVLLKTTVTNIDSGTSATYYLDVTGQTTVSVGHDMCSGAFIFTEGNSYNAGFEIVDGSGNTLPWTWANIEFTAPGMADFKTE